MIATHYNLTAEVTISGIEIRFDYSARIIAEIKNLPPDQRFWNNIKKCWVIAASNYAFADKLVKKYGAPQAEIKNNVEQVYEIPPMPELTVEIPIKRKLYPFQAQGVAYCLEKEKVIIGDQPGLGKTSQAIATIVAKDAFPCLIICPASLKINWTREWHTVAGMKSVILQSDIKETWPLFYKSGMAKVFIVNYESLKKYFVKQINNEKGKPIKLADIVFKENVNLFKSVIIDEIHRCKDAGAQWSKFTRGLTREKSIILGLTGTPLVNVPKDLVSQLGIIGRLQEFGGHKYFMDRYCGGSAGRGATDLKYLNYKLNTTCFYQRKKKDVLHELPDKVRQIVYCNISNRREYNDALNNLAAYLKEYKQKTDKEIQKSLRGEIMVLIGVCKDISARGKMEEVQEQIDEVIDAGEKIVVFIHQKVIAASLRAYYPHAVTVTGGDSGEERQANIDKFQNDPNCKLIICSIKAAGVGITLTAASRVLFVELPWHAADVEQCEDRCHRIGQKDSVQCTYVLGKDTIDEQIYEIIERKRAIASTVTGTEDETNTEIIDKLADSLFSVK